MRGLVYDGQLHLNEHLLQPERAGDQALIKLRQAGICNTDLELIAGYMGFSGVLGHEFVGEVIEGPPALVGRRVVGEINIADGDCEFCRRGIPSQCSHRTTLGIDRHPGAFSDYLALASRNLYPVPESISDDAAVFVEPLAAALQVTEAVHISPRDRVIVVGAGKLGLLTAQVLALTGCNLAVVIRREKQAALLAKWGIPAVFSGDLARKSADVVVDCTGTSEGFADGLDLVKPRGTIILKSTYATLPHADLTRVVVDEIRVIGSRCGPFAAALRVLEAGLVDVEALIEARYPFDQALEAMQHAAHRGVLKVLLDF